MGKHLLVSSLPLGVISNFLCSCGEYIFSLGELPCVMVSIEFEGDGLDHLLVLKCDRQYSLLFGNNCIGDEHVS
jgi:hypothetical protein